MKIKNIIAIILVIGVLVASWFGYTTYKKIFTPNTSFTQNKIDLYIPTNASFVEVNDLISSYINDKESFVMTAQKKNYTTNVKSGHFVIRKGMNNNEIINALRQNIPVKLVFNNQETLANLAGRVSQQIEADSLSILTAITNLDFIQDNGFTEDTALAMYIPNTYEFMWNTSANQFRERMAKEYRKYWNTERVEKAKMQNLEPIQVSILASIVHKESSKKVEQPIIARLYLNRLDKGMLLQADPTAVFAYKKHYNNFDLVIKRVLNIHTQLESPYNTYHVAGLPPGPICMPDISAIEAVLNPDQNDYLYMCASVEKFGFHEFAKTLTQHNINAAKYHNWVKTQDY